MLTAQILDHPDCVAAIWPSFSDLRSAAHATKPARLRLVISAMVSEARIVFGACFLLARAAPLPSSHIHAETGKTLH